MAFVIGPTGRAHVKWYVDDAAQTPVDLELLSEPVTVGLILGALALVAGWRCVGRTLPVHLPLLRPMARLAPWVPRLLGIHLGVALLALAVTNAYLAPHLSLDDVPGGVALALIEGAVGVWLISGVMLRPAALIVVALGPIGMIFTGALEVVEALETLGVALFLVFLPPGADRFGARRVTLPNLHRPLQVLRVAAGMALVILAFTEKLLAPDLAMRLLEDYPSIDVFGVVGLEVPAAVYIRIAAATELVLGLLLISGVAVQLAVLLAVVPFNLTLLVFDRYELIGHLPMYGVLLALLIYGSSDSAEPEELRDTTGGPTAEWRQASSAWQTRGSTDSSACSETLSASARLSELFRIARFLERVVKSQREDASVPPAPSPL